MQDNDSKPFSNLMYTRLETKRTDSFFFFLPWLAYSPENLWRLLKMIQVNPKNLQELEVKLRQEGK